MLAWSAFVNFNKTLLVLASVGVIFVLGSVRTASAQQIDQELLKRLQQERSIQPRNRQSPVDTARQGTLVPRNTSKQPTPEFEVEPIYEPSPLEEDYQSRLGLALNVVGSPAGRDLYQNEAVGRYLDHANVRDDQVDAFPAG